VNGGYAQALRLRGRVRALAASLAAAEFALRRDARRNDDPAMATLVAQLAAQRRSIAATGRDVDASIAAARTAALVARERHIEALMSAARRSLQRALDARVEVTAAGALHAERWPAEDSEPRPAPPRP